MSDFDAKAKDWDSVPARTVRAQTVADSIRARIPLTLEMHALDYGCGTGLLSFALQPYLGRITLADSSAGMLEVLARKISSARVRNMFPLRLDLSADPPPAERFRIIYTLMTLHHIPDTAGILRAFIEMLEAPGYICIADLEREDGSFHGPEFSGHKGFDREGLKSLALAAGFCNVEFETVFHTARETPAGLKNFPMFLMTARRRD